VAVRGARFLENRLGKRRNVNGDGEQRRTAGCVEVNKRAEEVVRLGVVR